MAVHNESLAERQDASAEPTMVTYVIRREASTHGLSDFMFVTTVGIDTTDTPSYARPRKALQSALDSGAVSDPGRYLVTTEETRERKGEEYFTGYILTVTTTPRIES